MLDFDDFDGEIFFSINLEDIVRDLFERKIEDLINNIKQFNSKFYQVVDHYNKESTNKENVHDCIDYRNKKR